MSNPQNRTDLLLSGLSRGKDIQAQSGIVPRKRQVGGKTEGQRKEERWQAMIYKRGDWYWTDFTEAGRRYRRPLKTTNWQEARTEERKVIEKARTGKLADSGVSVAHQMSCAVKRRWSTAGGSPARELVRSTR